MMRKAMICVSAMLALLQVWPLMFGHNSSQSAAHTVSVVAPKVVAAVATDASMPRLVPVSTGPAPAPKSCYRQYQARFGQCSPGDQACHVKAADDWDLCEATGFWPQ